MYPSRHALSIALEYLNFDPVWTKSVPTFCPKGKLKEKVEASKDVAFLSKTLATIKTDVDLPFDLNDLTFEPKRLDVLIEMPWRFYKRYFEVASFTWLIKIVKAQQFWRNNQEFVDLFVCL